jgi:hypothetical protein
MSENHKAEVEPTPDPRPSLYLALGERQFLVMKLKAEINDLAYQIDQLSRPKAEKDEGSTES